MYDPPAYVWALTIAGPAAIPHPKVLPGRLGCSVRGPGPAARARAAAPVRSAALSLPRTRVTCSLTVSSATRSWRFACRTRPRRAAAAPPARSRSAARPGPAGPQARPGCGEVASRCAARPAAPPMPGPGIKASGVAATSAGAAGARVRNTPVACGGPSRSRIAWLPCRGCGRPSGERRSSYQARASSLSFSADRRTWLGTGEPAFHPTVGPPRQDMEEQAFVIGALIPHRDLRCLTAARALCLDPRILVQGSADAGCPLCPRRNCGTTTARHPGPGGRLGRRRTVRHPAVSGHWAENDGVLRMEPLPSRS